MAPLLYTMTGSPGTGAVLMTAQALGLKLEQKVLDYDKGEHLTPEFIKINPQHTVPTLDDDGFVVWDSHAINAYLVGKYGKDDSLYPKDLHKRATADQRLHFDSSVLFRWLITIEVAFIKKEIEVVPDNLAQQVRNAYDTFEKLLKAHRWAAGNSVTIADFSIYTTILGLDHFVKIDPKVCPDVSEWIERVKALHVSNDQWLKEFQEDFPIKE